MRQTALYPSRIILSAENCHRATADWQCAVGTIVPKESGKTIRRIIVYCAFDHNSGTARFDNLSLRQEPLEGAAADYARIIDEKARRLAVMVQDVFEVSKAASGQLPVHLERLDFAKLLRQTLADLEGRSLEHERD